MIVEDSYAHMYELVNDFVESLTRLLYRKSVLQHTNDHNSKLKNMVPKSRF